MQMLTLKQPVGFRVKNPEWDRVEQEINERRRRLKESFPDEDEKQIDARMGGPYSSKNNQLPYMIVEATYIVVEKELNPSEDNKQRCFIVTMASPKPSKSWGAMNSPMYDTGGSEITIEASNIRSEQELPKAL